MKRGIALVAVAAATAVAASAWAGDGSNTLRRPLHIPRIKPGSRCPVTSTPRSGRAYPLLSTNPVVRYRFPALQGEPAYGSPWTSVPLAWRVTRGYRGPLLIRGRQLDGMHVLRFGTGQIPGTARWVPRSAVSGDRIVRSHLRLRAPGCYAFQVDGLTFSRTIVFRAELRGASTLPDVVAGLRAAGLPMNELGDFHSIAFDLLGVQGREYLAGARFKGVGSAIVLWEFATFEKAQSLSIDRTGTALTIHIANGGDIGASIFCGAPPCSAADIPPARHWFRSGRVVAVYLGDHPDTRRAIELVLGEQLAGT